MLSSKVKDLKLRILLQKHEKLARIHKFLFVHLASRGSKLNIETPLFKLQVKKLLFNLKYSSKTRIRAHCRMNGKTRGIYRPYYFSRMVMKELIEFGVLPGYKKAVW